MQAFCSLDPCEQISVKVSINYISFHINYISKYCTQNGGHIVSGRYGYLNVTIWFSCGKLLKVPFHGATLVKRHVPEFLCAFISRHDATNGYRFTFGLGSRYVGHSSVLIRECVGRLHAIRCYAGLDSVLNRPWIGVRSADICPIHNRSKTDKPSTIGGRIKTDTSRTLRDKTDTTPTYNRPTTDNLSGRDLSNMFERSLPDKFVCPNTDRHQTDKTESKPTVNRSLPEFDDFCRIEVGFVSVWPVCDWGMRGTPWYTIINHRGHTNNLIGRNVHNTWAWREILLLYYIDGKPFLVDLWINPPCIIAHTSLFQCHHVCNFYGTYHHHNRNIMSNELSPLPLEVLHFFTSVYSSSLSLKIIFVLSYIYI